ncbi:MAG TPA: sorbosone dehydrogenase family protein [Blastocatellia bacterium]|nr:sorbosone dehydrogenase family protein [Blastocatellia bacterium]
MKREAKLVLGLILAFTVLQLIELKACSRWGLPESRNAPEVNVQRIIIKPESLPQPYSTSSANNEPTLIAQPAGARLKVPAGFEVKVFAEGDFPNPRWMIEGPNGDLFVSDNRANNITLLRDANQDHLIDNRTERFVFASGLNQPFGMAIRNGFFYIANTDTVLRFRYEVGQQQLAGPGEKLIDLPAGGSRQHWTRNLSFSPDGRKLYVTVGSESDLGEEEPRRAAINEYNPDGTGHRVYASGLRNPTGLAWNPSTGQLWVNVNERDRLGDDLVPDYLTSVREGGFYGWPYSYIGQYEDQRMAGKRPDLVAKAIVPEVLFEAHSAALGLVFYTGAMFPQEYRGDAFVALHGSHNRLDRSGYKIVRVPFKDGRPEGGYENFLIGWVQDTRGKEVWGQPVGLTMIRDGSLLIVDDGARKIWRVGFHEQTLH